MSRDERVRIVYHLTCVGRANAEALAHDIALEQTVELPEECLTAEIKERAAGGVENVEEIGESLWRAVVSYSTAVVGDDFPQFLNLLFGNISLKSGILVKGIEWPAGWLSQFRGPRFGVAGLREICLESRRRPLVCAALKPVGLSATELADLCFKFALGGIDIIKDDHGLVDQPTARFAERAERCLEAVARANRLTGGHSLYFPNLTCGAAEIMKRLECVTSLGCRGVLLSPFLVGLDTVRWISEQSNVAILAHPSLAGGFFHPQHGIAPEVLLGQIFRVVGADGVIYPNAGGRFTFSEATCEAINANLRAPLGAIRPSFPVAAGGINPGRVPYWIDRYGADIIFLIGGGLYAQTDLEEASRQLVGAVKRYGDEESREGH